MDLLILAAALGLGFATGYGLRHYQSLNRRRRRREWSPHAMSTLRTEQKASALETQASPSVDFRKPIDRRASAR